MTAACESDGNQREEPDNAKQHLKNPTALGSSHISITVDRHPPGGASTVKVISVSTENQYQEGNRPPGRIPIVKGVRSPVADLPYRQQQGKEAFSPNHGKEALNPAQARELYSPARESVSPNQGNEGSSKSFHNPTNLKEVSNANNAKKENFAGSSMGEGSPGNSQMFNKENIGGKKSRIPDIR